MFSFHLPFWCGKQNKFYLVFRFYLRSCMTAFQSQKNFWLWKVKMKIMTCRNRELFQTDIKTFLFCNFFDCYNCSRAWLWCQRNSDGLGKIFICRLANFFLLLGTKHVTLPMWTSSYNAKFILKNGISKRNCFSICFLFI